MPMNSKLSKPFVPGSPLTNAITAYQLWLSNRDYSDARAARARLRRCADGFDAVAERGAHELVHRCEAACAESDGSYPSADRLLSVAPLLAWVETDLRDTSMPEQLARPKEDGGDRPRLSELRFQRLLAAQGDEVHQELRRALQLLDKSANTLWLAEAACYWNDEFRGPELRRRWAYEYYSHLPKAG